jgi:hypothetical protein
MEWTRSQLNPDTFLRTRDMGQNDSNRLIGLNVRVGPGSGNRAHPAHSPQIIQINRSRASALSGSMKTFMFFDWLGYTHRYSVSVPQPVKKHGSFCGSRKPWRPYVGREGRFRKNTALCVFGRARFSCGILHSPEIWLDVHRHHMFFVFCPPIKKIVLVANSVRLAKWWKSSKDVHETP